jgi:hypothetical protein
MAETNITSCPVCSKELIKMIGYNGAVADYRYCTEGHYNNLDGIIYEAWWTQHFSCKCEFSCGKMEKCPVHKNANPTHITKYIKGKSNV